LQISLFGKFHVQCGDQNLTDLPTHKAQEMFCYLLLHRGRPHPREALADLFCGEASTTQSKKCLRQTLWHLQTALNGHLGFGSDRLLRADAEWVGLNSGPGLWVDVAVFEQAFASVQRIPGRELDDRSVRTLHSAVQLYTGDLLEGWYQDWCLVEREGLQNMYLMMLDKLMDYCEAQDEIEAGLDYGARILRLDRARECTHRRLMRLYSMAGDRTSALRQYERCAAALEKELGVGPAEQTLTLYRQIRGDRRDGLQPASARPDWMPQAADPALAGALEHLRHLQAVVENTQHQLQQTIQMVELALKQQC